MSETDKAPPPRYTAVDLLRALLDEFQVDTLHDAIVEHEGRDRGCGHPRVKRFDEICAKAKQLLEENPLEPHKALLGYAREKLTKRVAELKAEEKRIKARLARARKALAALPPAVDG